MCYFRIVMFGFFLFFFTVSFAQPDENARLVRIMEEGVKYMDEGNYEAADLNFKEVLRNLDVLPGDITFYFGKNSWFLGQYKQSINWLNKYIELKGTSGKFFTECVEYLEKSEKAYQLEQEINQQRVNQEFSAGHEFDCKGREYFKCPLCLGQGVLITPGKLNTIYQTCPFCEGAGRITCDNYKKYLKGELKTND